MREVFGQISLKELSKSSFITFYNDSNPADMQHKELDESLLDPSLLDASLFALSMQLL